MPESDTTFLDSVADTLAVLPGVHAVTLGGSRGLGTNTPDSDWDLAVYYREGFLPDHLRAVGWSGEVSDFGAWGGGVFNGGALLEISGRKVDIHYRDLAVVERELEEAAQGRFHWEPLMFHLAGIPSYLLLAELASNRQLRGERLPQPTFPDALRASASTMWRGNAALTLSYAEDGYAARGQLAEVAGALVTAAMQTAHAVLAERGEWVTNEKRLLGRAGLRDIDQIIGSLTPDRESLRAAIRSARDLLQQDAR
ncbi:nucleotidyltransferase domain-containing protein [Rhodococcus sp. ABRD24]|uniref:nucleotidyltransferase domain-containing protein n=1 Tax=Rhodococcus sp. ABRD24 TaxID=2507582 RepID=UPI001039FA00|nr:nucleotidyltransferase domain-containing protein [Rhodococcus sp. ABRD24]QBJ95393.1 nucleotidyltransferase domain-containing protein [Rhodococcus sp. ABRD24]